jgi:hypothetical protein
MLPLARLEDEPKSGAILVYLFISATLIAWSVGLLDLKSVNFRLDEFFLDF